MILKVPLSDREEKILEEIEKNLYSEDDRSARPRPSSPSDDKRNARIGAALFVAGLAILVGFFLSSSLWVGLLAFAAMVAGAVLLASSVSALVARKGTRVEGHGNPAKRSFEAFEQRFRKRPPGDH